MKNMSIFSIKYLFIYLLEQPLLHNIQAIPFKHPVEEQNKRKVIKATKRKLLKIFTKQDRHIATSIRLKPKKLSLRKILQKQQDHPPTITTPIHLRLTPCLQHPRTIFC